MVTRRCLTSDVVVQAGVGHHHVHVVMGAAGQAQAGADEGEDFVAPWSPAAAERRMV